MEASVILKALQDQRETSLPAEGGSNLSSGHGYLMESGEEAIRLELKTDAQALRKQASWCGVKPGMRVLDLGCGPGKTTEILYEMVQPGGSVVGLDYSPERIAYALQCYGHHRGISFIPHDFRRPVEDIGQFDLIWVRFILEYYRRESPAIVRNLKGMLKPGGSLCLLDLDCNCLNHFELPEGIAAFLPKLMAALDEKHDFDTHAGRKLYSYLYDAGFESITMTLKAHHLIYGKAKDEDLYNWLKKVELATSKFSEYFTPYPGGAEAFLSDFKTFFLDPRRFTYTPLILCKGVLPANE